LCLSLAGRADAHERAGSSQLQTGVRDDERVGRVRVRPLPADAFFAVNLGWELVR
jgi:hypothetical protein